MKAVVLAAGLSTRLRHLTSGLPKTLLAVGDRTILDYELDSLFRAGIEDIALVVGFGKDAIRRHMALRYADRKDSIMFIENPIYEQTNNIYSLWLAREWIGRSDFLAMNADVLYHPDILLAALAAPEPISVIMDLEFREETMKVITQGERVVEMRKGIAREKSNGTYIGITRFSAAICPEFFTAMKRLVERGQRDVFFNVAVEELIGHGVKVGFTTTDSLPWAEVDDERDLEFARTHTLPLLRLSNEAPAAKHSQVGAGVGTTSSRRRLQRAAK